MATITLEHPVTIGDRTMESVELTDHPTVGMLEAMDKPTGDVGKSIALISSLCNVSPAMVRRMHTQDYLNLTEACQGVMGESPKAGGKS